MPDLITPMLSAKNWQKLQESLLCMRETYAIITTISYSKKLAVCALIRLQVNLPCVTCNTQKT